MKERETESPALPNSAPAKGEPAFEKAPRWTIAFLRSLERTGEVQAAAQDAGVDKSTAYARRKAHSDFGKAWEGAVCRHRVAKEARETEEIAALKGTPPRPVSLGRPSPEGEGIVNGQVKRVSAERWGERKEQIFFDELAATNNIHRAAAAAGVSYNAVHARRLKHPLFAAKWDAVARSARATIDMHLLEETRKSFDPNSIEMPNAPPRVTIDQAIKISQIGAAKKQEEAADPFAQRASAESVDEIRHRLVQKLQRLRRRERPKLLAQGWSYDEEYDRDIPPGWVKSTPRSDGRAEPPQEDR